MKTEKKIRISKTEQELATEDFERLELLQRANEKTGKQLSISADSGSLLEIDELRELIGKEFENPGEKYNIYYKGIRKLLMTYLPKGKTFKEVRDIIYDEKNIYLTNGSKKSDNQGIRKADGRMTFQSNMVEILDIVVKWVGDSRNPFQLYKLLYELNEKYEYGHETYDKSSLSVSKAMMKLSEK